MTMKREGNIPSEPPLGRKPRTSRTSRTSSTTSIAPDNESVFRVTETQGASLRQVPETQFLDRDNSKAVKKGKDLIKSQKTTLAKGRLSPRTRSQVSSMKRMTQSQSGSQARSIWASSPASSRASPRKRVRISIHASNGIKSKVGETSKVSKSKSSCVVTEKLNLSKVGTQTKKDKAEEEVMVRSRLSDIAEEPDHERSSPRFSMNSQDLDLFADSGSNAFNNLESESCDGSSQPAKKSKMNTEKKAKSSQQLGR
jgi:hypothetical protein